MKNIWIRLFLFWTVSLAGFSQEMQVGLFVEEGVQSVVLSSFGGNSELRTEGRALMVLDQNNLLFVSLVGDSLLLADRNGVLGTFYELNLRVDSDSTWMKVKPVSPALPHRYYDDGLLLRPDLNRILMVNQVGIDKYLAGVVQSEMGAGHNMEAYKAQAVLARTYALDNLQKHAGEGFQLCDRVHCQAFKGRTRFEYIREATSTTHGMVILEPDTALFATATFHSNCGGQTQRSQDVWVVRKPYLQSVTDPYCTSSRNAHWKREVEVSRWIAYLEQKGMPVSGIRKEQLRFIQSSRRKDYSLGGKSISLHEIRTDWNFPSTFFSVDVSGDNLLFRGRGFGHGVGLCQEGAIEMAKQGKSYPDILNFYFKGVRLVNLFEKE